MRLISLAIVTLGFSSFALAEPVSTIVDGGYSNGKHMQCKVYLSKPSKDTQKTTNLVFNQPGTGVYTTYFNHLKNQDYYFLTMDKPGILPDFKNPGKPIVDRKLFDYYTTKTLVTCAKNALYWAYDNVKDDNLKIVLQGHSEGTAVMINLTNLVYSDNNKKQLQNSIKALFLSGVMIQHMSDIIEFQFKGEDLKNLTDAYDKKDLDYIYDHYQVGWYWFDEIFHEKQNKLIELKDLAQSKQGRSLPIEIFQGLLDEDVSTQAVLDFEKANNSNPADQKLTLHARYYNAGHQLNLTTLFDVGVMFNYYFNQK